MEASLLGCSVEEAPPLASKREAPPSPPPPLSRASLFLRSGGAAPAAAAAASSATALLLVTELTTAARRARTDPGRPLRPERKLFFFFLGLKEVEFFFEASERVDARFDALLLLPVLLSFAPRHARQAAEGATACAGRFLRRSDAVVGHRWRGRRRSASESERKKKRNFVD